MSKENEGIDWEKEVDRQGLNSGLRKANDSVVVYAKLLGLYRKQLIKNGFSEEEAFTLTRDYSNDFLSKLIN